MTVLFVKIIKNTRYFGKLFGAVLTNFSKCTLFRCCVVCFPSYNKKDDVLTKKFM